MQGASLSAKMVGKGTLNERYMLQYSANERTPPELYTSQSRPTRRRLQFKGTSNNQHKTELLQT